MVDKEVRVEPIDPSLELKALKGLVVLLEKENAKFNERYELQEKKLKEMREVLRRVTGYAEDCAAERGERPLTVELANKLLAEE